MTSKAQCFFDIKIGENDAGRIVFELYNDLCPRTCENFRCLCTGEKGRGLTLYKKLSYKGCLFHRIVKNFMIQAGDFTEGNGTGGESIYGGSFADENLQMKHDRPYLLSMANRGPNTNGSQFFITTDVASHLDGKHVVFGHVVSGQAVVDTIENLPVDSATNRPLKDVIITNCGQLESITKSNKSKKRKISTGDDNEDENIEENNDNESSSSSDNDEKKKKSKHSKKSKKKEKHRRKKDGKRSSKKSDEDENTLKNNTGEISIRDTKSNIDSDELPNISESKMMRSVLNENEKTSRTNSHQSSKKVDSNGRPVKGRGIMRYTGKSRSRSRTPPHWRSAAEERKRQIGMNEQTNSNENPDTSVQPSEQIANRENSKRTRSFLKNGDVNDDQVNTINSTNDEDQLPQELNKRSRRHDRRRDLVDVDNDDDDDTNNEVQPQPVIQSSIVRAEPKQREHRNESKHHRSTNNNKHDENETSNHDKHVQNNSSPSRHKRDYDESHSHHHGRRRRRSRTSASPTKTDQQNNSSSSTTDPSSIKRRNRWENEEAFNERQTAAQHVSLEDELRLISQTNEIQSETTTQSNDIPQPIVTEVPSKSKWDDDDDDNDSRSDNKQQEEEMIVNSVQQNQIPSESSSGS
ncbi:unnamed protein product, partial [Adineta steineri]